MRCPRQPQAPCCVLVYSISCLTVPGSFRGVMAGVPSVPFRCLLMHLQAELCLPVRL